MRFSTRSGPRGRAWSEVTKVQDMRNLLDPAFVARLEGLRLLLKNRHRGGARGERLGRRRGASLEFAEHRDYASGEDLRHLDWNLLARLDRPYLKTYVEEEDLYVSFLLDASASMGFGTPSKLDRARRIVAALAYLALGNLDRVSLAVFDRSLRSLRPAVRGKASIFSLLARLASLEARGETRISSGLSTFARSRASRPGLAIVLSDFLDGEGAVAGLRSLAARGHELLCLHFVDEDGEELEGDLLLEDAETGETLEVTVNQDLLQRYRDQERAHREGLHRAATALGGRVLLVDGQRSLESVVLESLRQRGVVGP